MTECVSCGRDDRLGGDARNVAECNDCGDPVCEDCESSGSVLGRKCPDCGNW